jgi:hypothetical protein
MSQKMLEFSLGFPFSYDQSEIVARPQKSLCRINQSAVLLHLTDGFARPAADTDGTIH